MSRADPEGAAGCAIPGRPTTRVGWPRFWMTGALGLAAWIALATWTVRDAPDLTPCLFRRVSGVACMTCGMTRALGHLAKGELREAVVRHPLSPGLAAEALVAWLWWGGALAGRLRRPTPRFLQVVALANVAALLLTWILRLATRTLPP